ncbi:glycosyltransferase [Chryseobacterium sp. SNU WT5]|uniref:glycosyltransferase family 2 protein n=1 Tax=Chryseobacterium sp. SNU WT5 TaxID=2594269 RepID=UPI00117E8697|nr:glycosyltransferase [Chryseobacterium sp. SNU WT5]QDP85024.1 glycosyltransferase [Chryseobacterium sp. SNU WT5]
MPKISIIVPVYQVEEYLRKCLDSLVNQTLQDIEVIVVNDGSVDNSQSIIDEYQQKFPHLIKGFYKSNGGLSDARNFGLEQATGSFLGFVDSDDYVSPTMFEEMYELAKKHQADLVICNLQKVDQNGNVTQKLTQIPNMPESIQLPDHFSVFSDLSYFACNKIFKKELFCGVRFKKGIHFEDIQLIPQVLLKCERIAQTQTYHYNYLERQDSITKIHTVKGLDILKAVNDVTQFFLTSPYKNQMADLKNFQILEGVYTFIAYQAFVKDKHDYTKMSLEMRNYRLKNQISLLDLLFYRRFGKNYLLSLPLRKQIYYLFYFIGADKFLKKLL